MSWAGDPMMRAVARWRGALAVLVLLLAVLAALDWAQPAPHATEAAAAGTTRAGAAVQVTAQVDLLHGGLAQSPAFWLFLKFTAGSVAVAALVLLFFFSYRATYDDA